MGIAGMVIWTLTAGIGIYLLAAGIAAQRAAELARAGAAAVAAATAAAQADRASAVTAAAAAAAAQADRASAVPVAATRADSPAVDAADRTAAETADGTDGPAPAGADSTAVGTRALAMVMSGGPTPAAPVEGSPLLEFTHPALALLGLTFWIFFVMTGDRLFAWIAFGVLVATVTAGLSWEFSRRRTARQRAARRAAARDSGQDSSGQDSSGQDSSGQDSSGEDSAADGPGFPPHLVLAHGAAAACTFALVVIAAVAAGHG